MLTNATLRYRLMIAGIGLEEVVKKSRVINMRVNYYDGKFINANMAKALQTEYHNLYEYDIKQGRRE